MLIRTSADLGAVIRERRRRLRLDQHELAKIIGVSRQWVLEVEKGKPRAEVGLVLRALDALGVTLSIDGEAPVSLDAQLGVDIDEIVEQARDPHGSDRDPHNPDRDPHSPDSDPHSPDRDPHNPDRDPHS